MKLPAGTYFFKESYTKSYWLVRNGEKVGEVATRAAARKWFAAETREKKEPPCEQQK